MSIFATHLVLFVLVVVVGATSSKKPEDPSFKIE